MSLLADLKELSDSADALNSGTDDVTRRLLGLEKRLNEMKLGVNACTRTESTELIYCNRRSLDGPGSDNGWGLMISDRHAGAPTVINHSSRELRLRAAELVPALVKELLSETRKLLVQVEAARDVSSHWM